MRSTLKHWGNKTNSDTLLVLFVCISVVLSSLVLFIGTSTLFPYEHYSNSSPEPNPEPSPEPAFGRIEGIVTDVSMRTPIEGATMAAKIYSATTDVKGYYEIEVPAPGTYNLTASTDGYYPQTVTNIFVDVQATVAVNLTLTLIRGVILWFDDGLLNTYEVAKPILERYGYVGVVSAITWMIRNNESERYVWDDEKWRDKPIMILPELLTMQNDGWEVVSHSQSHPHLSGLPEYYARWEIQGSKEWIEYNLGPMKNPCFVYPYAEVYWESIVNEFYMYQRGCDEEMNWNPSDEYYDTHIPVVSFNLTQEIIEYWLNETNQKGGIAVFVLHGIHETPEPGAPWETTPETFEYLVEKIKELELPVLTLTQAIELYQVESLSNLSIGASAVLDDQIGSIRVKSETVELYDLQKLSSLCFHVILPVLGVLNQFPCLQSKPLKVAKATKGTAR